MSTLTEHDPSDVYFDTASLIRLQEVGPMTLKAIWNGTVVAESDDTVVVEGNHYFPRESLVEAHFAPSKTRSVCPWKGMASYDTITVDGAVNPDAAWEYRHPSVLARKVKGRVAFWHGVELVADDASSEQAASR